MLDNGGDDPCGDDDGSWLASIFLLFFDETEEERQTRVARGRPPAARPAPPPNPISGRNAAPGAVPGAAPGTPRQPPPPPPMPYRSPFPPR
jgi:hypothetical protein